MSSQIEQEQNLEQQLAWQRLRERLFAPLEDDLSEDGNGAILPADKPDNSSSER